MDRGTVSMSLEDRNERAPRAARNKWERKAGGRQVSDPRRFAEVDETISPDTITVMSFLAPKLKAVCIVAKVLHMRVIKSTFDLTAVPPVTFGIHTSRKNVC